MVSALDRLGVGNGVTLHRGGRKKGSYYNEEPHINQKKHIGKWTSKRNLLALNPKP